MYSSHMLDSNTLFGAHSTHGSYGPYSSYPNITSRTLDAHDRYYHALAEARSAELEILEGARREEALLQRRLQELRQARVEQSRQDFSHARYPIGTPSVDFPPHNHSRLEALRLKVQEEEQLATLEALGRERLRLHGTTSRVVAEENNYREILLLEAGLSYRPGIYKRVDTSHFSPAVSNETSFTTPPLRDIPTARPYIRPPPVKHSHTQKKPVYSDDLATRFDARRLHPELFSVNQSQEVPNVSFQPRRSRQDGPSVTSTPIDLNVILELLGLFASKNAEHQQEEKSTFLPKSSNGREKVSEIQDQGSARAPLSTKPENPKQKEHEKASSQASRSLDASLREQLEKRLKAEHEKELRDTIEAVLNSLYDVQPTSMGAETRSTQSPRPLAKGKEKEYRPSPESNSLSPSEVADNAKLEIKEIEKQFYALEREFIFPTNVEFITSVPTKAGSASATSYLSFTASNQPIRFFEQSLSQLLIKLDLIESLGNEELRNQRKDVVQKVELALEDLEKEVDERLKAKLAKESKRRSVTIEDVTTPDEHLVAEVVLSSRIDAKKDEVSGPSHPTPAVVSIETAETLSKASPQIAVEESITTQNPVDQETLDQDPGSRENTATESHAQESILQVNSSDIAPQIDADSLDQRSTSSGLGCSEPKDVYVAESCNSGPDNTAEEPVDQIQTESLIQEPPSTESQDTAAAWLLASAGLDTWTQSGKKGPERERLSHEETSDISDVESASSGWSEVDAVVAR